ncbi:2,3-bisphosphoglycerate-independent phosphoglycerate mutase [Kordiimonas pumila]|uniref:2,3-bisphosphoglycerate-independent phosphoglycerate mutase n=1 Tax=Kordiimonas pumila TaxID=2161677 RepID=A0ABV7D7X4_9PROT|nr:2,3-bisphosphoglycerate-independent phosphoglycerate mutase [Kordiimonas pumila]
MTDVLHTIKKPVVLCILDGWGYRDQEENNAIKLANTPTYDRLWNSVPRAWLKTSGLAVGLPEGQMGNSEVGHMNLGSGRVVLQDLPKIDLACKNGGLAKNPELIAFIDAIKKSGGTAHVTGLLSPGGVHSHQDHIATLVQILSSAGVPVKVHAFLDGRDTPPRSALTFLEKFEADIAGAKNAAIASIVGRYWAMDRDKRWDRVAKAYNAMVKGKGEHTASSATEAVNAAYGRDENDEFAAPTIIGDYTGMKSGDGLLMANFRADRAREILEALVDPGFSGFSRPDPVKFAAELGMVEYSSHLNAYLKTVFPSEDIKNSLGEILADAGINQLRIAETEKYAHVTFFFNGGLEVPFDREDRILVPSPDVATYDLKPEMSAPEVTDKLVAAITSGKYGAIIVNFANPDMVGHTGILSAAIKAVETIDDCITKLEAAVKKAGGAMIVTADHGNVEMMTDDTTGQPHTAHTNFDVPALLINHQGSFHDGALSDIAPTLLHIMGIPQPAEMTGKNLVDDAA